MATDTVAAGSLKVSAAMTRRALQAGMDPREGETCEPGMIERCPEPTIHDVALLARGWESCRTVIGHRRLEECLGVAGDAFRGKARELARRRALVTRVTGDGRVRTDQGKPVLVASYRLQGNLPAFYRVALFALRSKLAPMNVRVAVTAFRADVGEDQAAVALLAGDPLVETAQRVARLVMVKLDDVAERFPGGESVAVLAGDIQTPVGAARGGTVGGLRGRKPRRHHHEDGQQPRTQPQAHGFHRPWTKSQ